MPLTKDQIWNLSACATDRTIHYLLRHDNDRANRECATAEALQRWHSYTLIDHPNLHNHAC